MKKLKTPLHLYKSHKFIILYLILSAAILINSCKPCVDDDEEKTFPVTITPILVAKGDSFGMSLYPILIPPQNLVITNHSTWNDLLRYFSEDEMEDYFVETTVDFTNHYIISVLDEDRGYQASIDISDITEYVDKIVVSYTTSGPLSIVAAGSKPFHIVKIPKSQKEVVFNHIQ